MLQLYANVMCVFVRDLTSYQISAKGLGTGPVTEADRDLLDPVLKSCDDAVAFLYLPATAARKARLVATLALPCTYAELDFQLRMLRETFEDEIKGLLVLYMPPGQAMHYYSGDQLLGTEVIARFPQLGTDIDEAGKCFGSGRYTASVFHLMRILEAGVQEFGAALGVSLVDAKNVEKNWHNIIEESDKAIKALAKGDPKRPALSEVSAALFAVKLAWRNEVMHPKASYSADEAENVIGSTKTFMNALCVVI